jgi:type IV secretion system protein VirB4
MAEKIESKIVDDSENFYAENIKNLPSADLLPYACYIDDKTILTENGELLQTIKIPSFVDIKNDVESYKLRDDLNAIFEKKSGNKNLNFWFQTVRKKENILPKHQKHENYITKQLMDKWDSFYNWENQFTNEIYVTIVISPQETSVSKVFDFMKGLTFNFIKKSKLKEIKKMREELGSCVNDFLKHLEKYEPVLLGVVKKDNIYYSEHLAFFNLIINGENRKVKLPINKLSESLVSSKKIFYEMNAIKASNRLEQYFYSMVSIKYCSKLLLSQLDRIIQLNQEMVVTQTVSFADARNLKESYAEKLEKLSVNEDDIVANLSEYPDLMKGMREPYANCVSQLTIQLKGKTREELEGNVRSLLKVTKHLGLVAVREEMFMPTLFWSQLPANFNFIKRFQLIPYDNVCAYTSLYNFPIGKISNNHWGDCLGIIKSTLETPYFLPLHAEKNGNFAIIGPKNFRKTKYLNLLVMMSLKQCKSVYYLDCTNRSNIFINSLGGGYYFITKRNTKNRLLLNPFSLEKTPDNINFIVSWLKNIVFVEDLGMIKLEEDASDMVQEWEKLEQIIRRDIANIKKIGDVRDICDREKFQMVKNVLNKWCDPEKYGMIFNDGEDIFLTKTSNIMGLNLSSVINNEILRIAVVDYVIHRIIEMADGGNTVLAIDESWVIFDDGVMGEKLVNIFQKLYAKNIAMITSASGSNSYETSFIKFSTKNIFSSRILLPNIKTTVYQKKVFSIPEEEVRVTSIMRPEKGSFLLKSGRNTVVSSFDFSFLSPEERAILEGNNTMVNIMKKAKELINSELPKDWLPLFFLLIKEYNKKKNEEKIREREKRQIKWEEVKQGSNSNTTVLMAE